jgi:Mn2+/Fe2+ NRAMP family transporter
MRKLYLYACTVLALILVLAMFTAATSQLDPQCITQEVQRTYVWTTSSSYVSCTFLQQVSSELSIVFIIPIFIASPATILILFVLGYKMIRRKKLGRSEAKSLLVLVCVLLSLSLAVSILYTIGSLNETYP